MFATKTKWPGPVQVTTLRDHRIRLLPGRAALSHWLRRRRGRGDRAEEAHAVRLAPFPRSAIHRRLTIGYSGKATRPCDRWSSHTGTHCSTGSRARMPSTACSSGRRGRRSKSGHPDPGHRPLAIFAGGLFHAVQQQSTTVGQEGTITRPSGEPGGRRASGRGASAGLGRDEKEPVPAGHDRPGAGVLVQGAEAVPVFPEAVTRD